LLRARLLPLPLPFAPACVFDVVFVDWLADVVWFVVPLGLMVTVLCGIALNCALVLTEVLALGAVDWPAVVLVSLPAWFVCAIAPVLNAANTAAAMMLRELFRVMWISSRMIEPVRCSFYARRLYDVAVLRQRN
jgi:hypothetical protein